MLHIIIGRREQGKTTLALYMASKVDAMLIFDPRGIVGPESRRVREVSELAMACRALYDRDIGQVSYTPDDELSTAWPYWGQCVAAWMRRDAHRPLAAVVDEAAFVPLESSPQFEWVCRTSKRSVMQILLTAHRPRDIHTSIRAIADHWLLFGTRQEHDLRVIEEHCSRDVADLVQALGPREFVHWDDTSATAHIYRDPAVWYVDLAAVERPAAAGELGPGEAVAGRGRQVPLFGESARRA
jgi:hypothetical protein